MNHTTTAIGQAGSPAALRGRAPIELYLFGGVFALRLLALTRLTGSSLFLPTNGDMHFYNSWALRILHGYWTDHLAFYGLPLYAYLLAGIYELCGATPFMPGLLQAALEGGTAVILYRLALAVFGDRPGATRAKMIGIMAALGWALFQPAQSYSIILMPTTWLVFVFWFVVWQIVRRKQAPGVWILFGWGTLMGFSAMGIATILFLVPLTLAAIFVKWTGSQSMRAVGAAVLLVGVSVGTSPAWIHNCFVARDPVFLSAHSGINFWIGNNPTATGYPKFPPGLHAEQQAMLSDSIRVAEQAEGHPLRRSEVSSYWSTQAVDWIGTHPLGWAALVARKIEIFWNAFQYDDLSVISELREQEIILPGLGFGLIAALALPGMLIACWQMRDTRWIAAAIFLHMASLLSVFVTERYRLIAVPGLLLFAGFALWELWWRVSRARYLETFALFWLILGSTAFVSLPQRDQTLWALDTYNSGLKALDAGHLSDAQRKLDLAYAYSPYNAGVNFAEGNLAFAKGEVTEAKGFYQSTLHLDPRHTGAWNNLGVLALREERWELAARCFARSLEQSQDAGKTFYLLAEAQFRSGNLLAADTAIVHALAVNPARPEFRTLADRISIASNIPPLP